MKKNIKEVTSVFLSFFIYVIVYFIFMGVVCLALGINDINEQLKYYYSMKESMVLMFFAGGLWGFSRDIYDKIQIKIDKIINKLTFKHKLNDNL